MCHFDCYLYVTLAKVLTFFFSANYLSVFYLIRFKFVSDSSHPTVRLLSQSLMPNEALTNQSFK